MNWTTDAMWAQATDRQAQLRHDADQWRLGQPARDQRRQRRQRRRGGNRLRQVLSGRPSTV